MTVHDTCKCGAVFSARGYAAHVQNLWVAWINAHMTCRNGRVEIELVD